MCPYQIFGFDGGIILDRKNPETIQMKENKSLAMAYVIPQSRITQVYKSMFALKQGTLFPELDKPFMGKRGVC